MGTRGTETLSDTICKFISIKFKYKFIVRRSYDNWTWKQIFADKKRRILVSGQKLDLQAHSKLGSDLAASKFVVHACNGKIRNQDGIWIDRKRNLPSDYDSSFKLTAISVNGSQLMTEGVDNFVGLAYLQSLDLSYNKNLDDFACDQLSRQFRKSTALEEINLSYNPRVSVYGLEVLFRIPSIRRIVAIGTGASDYENIDLFTLAAEDERGCSVYVLDNGRQFKLQELEDLRFDRRERIAGQ